MGVEATTNWGLDVSGFRSRRLTGELVDEADLVLTAERRHRQFILDDHAHAFGKVLTLGQAVRAASVASAQRRTSRGCWRSWPATGGWPNRPTTLPTRTARGQRPSPPRPGR